ncbi:MAG: hypothetical protein ACUVYA_17805 [Planctomycetota bacterium]
MRAECDRVPAGLLRACAAIALALGGSGCTYLENRGRDLGHIISLGVSDGGGVAARIAPTRLVTLEAGGRKDETFYGIRRLKLHWVESSWGLPFSWFWTPRLGREPYREWLWSDVFRTSHAKLAFPALEKPTGQRIETVEEIHHHLFVLSGLEDARIVDLFDLEVNLSALVGGVQVVVSPGELLDFLAGLATLDLAGDDVAP